MLQLELPHVNVLSKFDILQANEADLDFSLDFYTDVMELSYLTQIMSTEPHAARYTKLTAAIAELVEDFGLVQFHTLDVNDVDSIGKVTALVDKASGYILQSAEVNEPEFMPAEDEAPY